MRALAALLDGWRDTAARLTSGGDVGLAGHITRRSRQVAEAMGVCFGPSALRCLLDDLGRHWRAEAAALRGARDEIPHTRGLTVEAVAQRLGERRELYRRAADLLESLAAQLDQANHDAAADGDDADDADDADPAREVG